jgi:hypothetical protein
MIVRFCIYDTTSGAILRMGSCPDMIMSLQPAAPTEGALAVDDTVTPQTHHVVGGAAVPL